MTRNLLLYRLGPGVEAFTAGRETPLPYPVTQGHQVHGTRIAIIDRPGLIREDLEGYDAFITDIHGIAIGVRTADCTPVLLYDPVRRVIAAVHSGWRGTVRMISRKTLAEMEERFRTNAADVLAVIGPCIGPDSFQVGMEVVEQFREAGFPMQYIWSDKGPGDGSPMSGGHHLDLFKANKWILEGSGLRPGNIQVYAIDTYSDHSFYSARREGVGCGRNINSIKLV